MVAADSRIQGPGDQQGSLGRVRFSAVDEHGLDGVRKSLEQATVAPRAVEQGRGPRLGFPVHSTSKIPAVGIVADFQHRGFQSVAVLDQDRVRLGVFVAGQQPRHRSRPSIQFGQHRCLGQVQGPASLACGVEQRLALEHLDPGDSGLADLSAGFHHRLQHLETVESVGFQRSPVNRDGLGDLRAAGQFQARSPLGQWHRAAGQQWHAVGPCHIDHLAGPVPAVGVVLVIEQRHVTSGTFHHRHRRVEEPLPGVHLLAKIVDRVVAVFADRQDGIDSQRGSPDAHRLLDRIEQWHLVFLGDIPCHVAVGKLVGVKRDDVDAGIDQATTKEVRAEEVLEDVVGVRTEPELGENRCNARSLLVPGGRGPGEQAGSQGPGGRTGQKISTCQFTAGRCHESVSLVENPGGRGPWRAGSL